MVQLKEKLKKDKEEMEERRRIEKQDFEMRKKKL